MPANNFKVGEMLEKRTPNSKTWMNFDGSYTTEIHTGFVHYEDENGNLQNINTDLYDEADFDSIDFPVASDGDYLFFEVREKVESEKKRNRLNRENFDFQGLKVPFEAKLPRNIRRGYSIGKGASKLTFIPLGASPSKGYVEGNKITYQDAWNDTDLILEVLPEGIKETIILKSERSPFNFSFEVQGNLESEMKILPPWLQDAEGTKRDVVQGVSETDGKILLNLAADVSDLVYPIEIDPTVTIQPDVSAGKDAYIDSYDPNTNFGTNSIMYVGQSDRLRSLIQFDLSIINGPVSSAILILKKSGGNGSPVGYAYPITSTWNENTVTHSTVPTSDSSKMVTGPSFTDGFNNFDITNIAKEWINGTLANNGILLAAGSSSAYVTFYTSEHTTVADRPKLTITYNQPPTSPTVIAPNGGETWNSSHTILWERSLDEKDITVASAATYSGLPVDYKVAAQTYLINENYLLKSVKYDAFAKGYSTQTSTITMKIKNSSGPSNVGSTVLAEKTITFTNDGSQDAYFTLDTPLQLTAGQRIAIEFSKTNNWSFVYAEGNKYTNGNIILLDGGYVWPDGDLPLVLTVLAGIPLQYQIQLSTNNGVNWKNIVSLTPTGATSYQYDFINEPETSLAKIRIRAFDGSAYGPWDESNGVFTIQHNQAPTAPSNLNPSSGTRDRAAVIRFSWQHNDANADPQAKFDFQWRVQGETTWNEVTQTTVDQFYDSPAGIFPRGTIEWRVRTYDQDGLSSPYSAISIFFTGDKPIAPTIVLPGSTVAVANPTVQWSSTEQTGFLLNVKDSTGTTVFSKERNSTNKAETITYSLENQQNYTIELRVKNADGLYSDAATLTIFVSYTPPAIPDIETVKGDSFIQIYITDQTPTGTQTAVIYHEIYKEIENEFVLIATGVQAEYKDYNVASGKNTRYFVRTQGDNGTFSDTITFSEIINFTGIWLHIVEEPEISVHQFKYDGEGRSSKWELESATHYFQGRTRPVIETGEMEDYTVDFSLILKSEAEMLALENIIYSQETVCYRDGRGRKVFGVFVNAPINDETWRGYTTSLSLTKIDFKEEIE